MENRLLKDITAVDVQAVAILDTVLTNEAAQEHEAVWAAA